MDAVSTTPSSTRASAARQAGAWVGDDLLQVDRDPDQHQPGEDPGGPRLGQEVIVPSSVPPLVTVAREA